MIAGLLVLTACKTSATKTSPSGTGSVRAEVAVTFPESDASKLIHSPEAVGLIEFFDALNDPQRRALLHRILCDATSADHLAGEMAMMSDADLTAWLILGEIANRNGSASASFYVGTAADDGGRPLDLPRWTLDSTFQASSTGPRSVCLRSLTITAPSPLPVDLQESLVQAAMTVEP